METLIWVLIALLLCALAGLAVLCVRVLIPVKKLRELTARLDPLDAEALRREAAAIPGPAGDAARDVAAFAAAAGAHGIEEAPGGGAAEQDCEMRVVDEICSALLPKPMKDDGALLPIALAGGIQDGTRRACAFYDHFFPDGNTLCLAVGEVPGSGIAEALFSVVAQTILRSRLRLGLSLTETMSDVSNQLYDLSGRYSVNAVVCVLNVRNGSLTIVNAGGTAPYLMRSEGQYEPLETPVCAPLGANESVSYRAETVQLSKGDRLFFYTSDLGALTDRDGETFGAKALPVSLNRSRSRTESPEELLRFIHDEAAAFCESGDDVLLTAAVALEYRACGGDAAVITVSGTPEEAPRVTEFLRKTLEDSGVPAKDCARPILLGEELFTLCCRACRGAAEVRVECAPAPAENAFRLRVTAPMGGSDPLCADFPGAGGEASAFIRAHAGHAAFEPGAGGDTLDIVFNLI